MDSKVDKASDKLRLSYTLMIRLLILANKKNPVFSWNVVCLLPGKNTIPVA